MKKAFKRPSIFLMLKVITLCIGLIILAIGVMAYEDKKINNHDGENTMKVKAIEDVIKEHTPELMSLPGVVGTAIGLCDNKPCIKVFVIKMTVELDGKIPKVLNGYHVEVEETGEFRALP